MTPLEQVNLMFAPLYVMGAVLAYTVFVHSRRRWPWAGWWTRLVYILTFGTPPKPPITAVDGGLVRDDK